MTLTLGDVVKTIDGIGKVVDVEVFKWRHYYTVDFGALRQGYQIDKLEFIRHGDDNDAVTYKRIKLLYGRW